MNAWVCSNTNILGNNVYLRVCESWDHQILRTQKRTFESKILYTNKHIQPELKYRRSSKKKTCTSIKDTLNALFW